ncbi:MAG TPA: SET domain-containing protein [Bryobacteraceae bacterium]|nr:SET domain-containing protein [Bryobacteraceae bacterium]
MDHLLPHDDVHARLGVSPIHGIGVFAIVPIGAGIRLFGPERGEVQPVPAVLVDSLPAPIRQIYQDFCVPAGGNYYAPASFNQLTIAWYLNHSDKPNVACTHDEGFISLRQIAPSEELTLDYHSFYPGPLPWQS